MYSVFSEQLYVTSHVALSQTVMAYRVPTEQIIPYSAYQFQNKNVNVNYILITYFEPC